MGIKGLAAYLKQHAPKAWEGHAIAKQETPMKVAVDVSLFLHKFFYSKLDLTRSFGALRENLLAFNYVPVWIFDGNKLELKREEHERRRKLKDARAHAKMEEYTDFNVRVIDRDENETLVVMVGAAYPGHDEYELVKRDLEEFFGDETRIAKYEAEALCSYLVKTGEVYAAVTDDSDALAYACPRIFRGVKCTLDRAVEVRMQDILEELQIHQDVFQKFCVLCGGDFCTNEKQTGPVSALKKAKDNYPLHERYQEVLHVFQTCCHECSASESLTEMESSPTESPNL